MKNHVYTEKIQSFTGGIENNNKYIKLSSENEIKKIKIKKNWVKETIYHMHQFLLQMV